MLTVFVTVISLQSSLQDPDGGIAHTEQVRGCSSLQDEHMDWRALRLVTGIITEHLTGCNSLDDEFWTSANCDLVFRDAAGAFAHL
eukprot:6214110-Pleurochrysis_carterae.AAC.1